MIERTEEEIQELADKAKDLNGKYPGMTYEEGITAALEWVLGYDKPLED